MTPEGFGLIGVVIFVIVAVSNCAADQATLRDCSTTGESRLMNGGTISCEVKKESGK